MPTRIEIWYQPERFDPLGAWVTTRIQEDLGLPVQQVRTAQAFNFKRDFDTEQARLLRAELFGDPIVHDMNPGYRPGGCEWVLEIGYRPGVTDNIGKTSRRAAGDLLQLDLDTVGSAYASHVYALYGNLSRQQVEQIANDLLSNQLIQQWQLMSGKDWQSGQRFQAYLPEVVLDTTPTVNTYNLHQSDDALQQLSQSNVWALTLAEMHAIREYLDSDTARHIRARVGLSSTPTDVEMEVLAQTWSEHCKHKIFGSTVHYTDESGKTRVIESLFKTYIKATTEQLAPQLDWLVSVFHDNAGIIRFDDHWDVSIKVETHNSPSALDPYGGALTGIVGVNRDPLGTGMGCKLIFNTDVFCFGSPFEAFDLPAPFLHPRRIIRGVHAGVKDGANTSGIPDINGAIVFDTRFAGRPLVFCGTGGIIPHQVGGAPSARKEILPGDMIVMTGGRVGKDGIHGATFSSEPLHEGSPVTAVQIGDPITQKKMTDFLLEARDLGLYRAITDNGAGGLSSSVGELAQISGGAQIDLHRVPLKYPGLAPWEIFVSESQERMTLAVPPDNIQPLLELARRREVEATVLGQFTDTGYLQVCYNQQTVACLHLEFLHNGWPNMNLAARWQPSQPAQPIHIPPSPLGLGEMLLRMLSRLNVCSKENFVRQYDHEVQAASVVKPFVGVANDGPSDAAVVRPILSSNQGLAVACGICPKYSDFDAYLMAQHALDEAVRNLICVGAQPHTIAGLDNFCWPDPTPGDRNPDAADKMGQLVRACEGLQQACLAYQVPLVSGKDSMKNDVRIADRKISIPPTLLVTVIGRVPNVNQCVTMDFKHPGDLVAVVGATDPQMGGSEYQIELGLNGDEVPAVRLQQAWQRYEALADTLAAGLVKSCHDCSDGGLAVALAESAFAGGWGAKIDLAEVPVHGQQLLDEQILFAETPSRFVISFQNDLDTQTALKQKLEHHGFKIVGTVTDQPMLEIVGIGGNPIINEPLSELKTAWQTPLQQF